MIRGIIGILEIVLVAVIAITFSIAMAELCIHLNNFLNKKNESK